MAARSCAWGSPLDIPVLADDAHSPSGRRRPGSLLSRAAPKASAGSDSGTPSAYARGRDFIARCIAGDPGTRAEFVKEYSGLVRFAIASVLRQRSATFTIE